MSLLARIQAHLRRTGMSPSRFGRHVANDPRFVRDLLNGREPRPAMTRRVSAWIDAREAAR